MNKATPLEILKYGHPILRAKGRRVAVITNEIRELAADMLETMHAANGVGLAAQQVGRALQLTVIDVANIEDRPSTISIDGKMCDLKKQMPLTLVNPQLELGAERETGNEGCLSFPDITAEIDRAISVVVEAETLEGKTIRIEAAGLLARALQHEVDHLHGILFIDRMSSVAKASLSSRLKRLKRETLRPLKS